MTLRAPIKEANNNSNRGCDWRFFLRRSLRLDNDDGIISLLVYGTSGKSTESPLWVSIFFCRDLLNINDMN